MEHAKPDSEAADHGYEREPGEKAQARYRARDSRAESCRDPRQSSGLERDLWPTIGWASVRYRGDRGMRRGQPRREGGAVRGWRSGDRRSSAERPPYSHEWLQERSYQGEEHAKERGKGRQTQIEDATLRRSPCALRHSSERFSRFGLHRQPRGQWIFSRAKQLRETLVFQIVQEQELPVAASSGGMSATGGATRSRTLASFLVPNLDPASSHIAERHVHEGPSLSRRTVFEGGLAPEKDEVDPSCAAQTRKRRAEVVERDIAGQQDVGVVPVDVHDLARLEHTMIPVSEGVQRTARFEHERRASGVASRQEGYAISLAVPAERLDANLAPDRLRS